MRVLLVSVLAHSHLVMVHSKYILYIVVTNDDDVWTPSFGVVIIMCKSSNVYNSLASAVARTQEMLVGSNEV